MVFDPQCGFISPVPDLEVNPEHRIFFIETPSPRLSKAKLLKAYESQYTEHVFAITKAQSIRP